MAHSPARASGTSDSTVSQLGNVTPLLNYILIFQYYYIIKLLGYHTSSKKGEQHEHRNPAARWAALSPRWATPARLRIVELLCQQEHTRQRNRGGHRPVPVRLTSQHLAILTRSGVLVVEPHGAARVYRVRGPRIGRVLALIEEFCQAHELYGLAGEVLGQGE